MEYCVFTNTGLCYPRQKKQEQKQIARTERQFIVIFGERKKQQHMYASEEAAPHLDHLQVLFL